MGVYYLTVQEVVAINIAMIQKYSPGEDIGVKNSGLLESAVSHPQSSAFGEEAYASLFEKGVALFQSLGQNHPFQNANKRTAFTALVVFLRMNGYHFMMDQKKSEDLVVDMVNHKYEFHELVRLIQEHCNKYQ